MPQTRVEDYEPRFFGRYLLGHMPSERAVNMYLRASRSFDTLDDASRRLMSLAYRYPWLLGAIDNGLALKGKSSSLRFRIWAMSAILETCPEYFSYFSPVTGIRAALKLIFAILRAPFRALIGIIVVSVNE